MNRWKGILVICCFGAFSHKIYFFLLYYWTYAVVIDIQTTAPDEFPMPAISFCNSNGIIAVKFCRLGELCLPFGFVQSVLSCNHYPPMCEKFDYRSPPDLKLIPYKEILKHNIFTPSRLDTLKKPIKEFFRCKIISSTGNRNCSIEDAIVGSYYSDSDFFGICYTINSKWKQPNKALEKIKRSDKIEIEFYVDLNDRHMNASLDTVVRPKFNYPSFVVTQLGLHNNFVSLNPYQNGVEFQGGKQYEITLKQMAMEECKYNLSLEDFGCIPFTVDYPHKDSICRVCEDCYNMTYVESRCEKLLGKYNQPCECQTIHVDILFNDFEITTTTYKPKLESLELLSIIGSYMGMYLGISMTSSSWLFEIPLSLAARFLKKRRRREKKMEKIHSFDRRQSHISVPHRLHRTQVFEFNM
ncbi:uncharacterized protein TNIN_158801 [Trichonephila inaurata madagascariensis]|uniref:Uncharacterized protein n=1 Tax=Trichonephila inaurata madagascariensis TaxID=2747483 RepID=A0A8X6XPB2_9ARAC|nr:uncharacterized protein TNIN_158801 [Trichonephila inaurata madagascariensis]